MNDPTFLSLVPAAITIVMAIVTRRVILALGVGVLVGMTILEGFDPLRGLLAVFRRGIFPELATPSNAQTLILICIIGGFVNQLEMSGGMRAFASRITGRVGTRARAQIAVMLGGFAIFFTDSGNSLVLGPIFSPVFDRLKLCREKLAFILDSTSAPVCVLVPFIGWGAYIMSLIEQAWEPLGREVNPLEMLVSALPYQFYPLLALASIPIWAAVGRDFGPMKRAQREREAMPDEPGGASNGSATDVAGSSAAGDTRAGTGVSVVLVPLLVMMGTMISFLAYFLATEGALSGDSIRTALAVAYLTGAIVGAFVVRRTKGTRFAKSMRSFVGGMQRMVPIAIILLFAWSLGEVCSLLGTGEYVATLVGDKLPGAMLPAMLFLFGAVVSLSTGSSWGTFAILMPIAIPLAVTLEAPVVLTIAAVLSGGIFGDHTSPISDTTILSSMATRCDHARHVNTQLPYALLTGAGAFVSFVVAGHTMHPASVAAGLAVLVALVVGMTRKGFGYAPIVSRAE